MPEDSENDAEETLRRLEERLDRASDVAERLVAEVAAEASATASRLADRIKPPPAGWQLSPDPDPDPESKAGTGAGGDSERIQALLQGLRELIPTELQQRVAEALRQLLLAIRALVDWYLERLEARRSEPAEVQDIPIL